MSSQSLSRRRFLTLSLALLAAPLALPVARAQTGPRKAAYAVDVGLLYGLLVLHMDGTFTEVVDRETGRYEVRVAGEGDGIASRIESRGVLRDGRWTPQETHTWFQVKERESRSDIRYEWKQRTIEYRFRGETFFLRRLRMVDDVVPIPDGLHVDDAISATLNFADGLWPSRGDGSYQTHVIRRKKAESEGPDDVQASYRAELIPFLLNVETALGPGRRVAVFDLSRFSSWAKRGEPARVTFGPDMRPEVLTMPMILGTSVKVQFGNS